ncbi:hypothetical protein QYM36_002437 [Artemia franciscana]|uniref:Reverse transcriptase domain-containing protein n=1 Tax=Artemia franciscana TaxID=6661 RepID=A0AA88LHC7_ARTSF|nr:hypothetical protein QYM36_002437 [Artemia franciscana]
MNFLLFAHEAPSMPTFDQAKNSGNQDDIQIDSLSHPTEKRKKGLFGMLMRFRESFSKIPRRTSVVRHHTDTVNAPSARQKPNRVPQSRLQAIEEEVKRMLDLGIMQPSSSPWCSPVVVVAKPDGSIRFCLDFRGLNRVSNYAYPLLRIDELLEEVGNKMVFSVLDLTKGYWQVKLTPESTEKTAKRSPDSTSSEYFLLGLTGHQQPSSVLWIRF